MFGMGPWELLIILAIVLLIFGPRRLKTLGSDLGTAIKGFRRAVNEREDAASREEAEQQAIEGEPVQRSGEDAAGTGDGAGKAEQKSNV